MYRLLCTALVCMLLVALLPAAPVAAQRDPTPPFAAAPCSFALPDDLTEGEDVTCGVITVPEDHAAPDGPALRLAVAIFPDRSPTHHPDPVFVLCGGPGALCLRDAVATAQLLQPLHAGRDLVLFDQRGVGYSEPALDCPESLQASLDVLTEPDPVARLRAQVEALFTCHDRLVADGINLSAFNTTQSAADVEAIRVALGYEQINLYGGSYGSQLAQAVMRDYPAGVRSAVIDSVLPLEASLLIDLTTTASDALLHLLDACAADDACHAAYPDLAADLFAIIAQLNAEPIPITLTNPLDGQPYDALLTGDEVFGDLIVFLYDTTVIPVLPQVIDTLANGDYGLVTQLSSARLARPALFSHAAYYAVLCADDLIGRAPADLHAAHALLPDPLRPRLDPDVVDAYGPFGVCARWDVAQADPAVKEPLMSDIPTLALAGEFDPVTPPEYAEQVVATLSNGHAYTFPGVGHSVSAASPCAQAIVRAFLADPTRAPDAACIDAMPGVLFDLPVAADAAITLEPFTTAAYSGVAPAGWTQVAPGYTARGQTALDQTQLIHDGGAIAADALLARLAGQLGFPADLPATHRAELGRFTWAFYEFTVQGLSADLALAGDETRAYFVLLITAPDERDALYEAVFLPAVEALAPVE